MGYYRRKLEDWRRTVVEKEAAARRGELEDGECLIAAWNERLVKCMPCCSIGAATASVPDGDRNRPPSTGESVIEVSKATGRVVAIEDFHNWIGHCV